MDAPVVRMVPIDSVRAEFEKAWPISSKPEQAKKDKDTRRATWNRCLKDARERELIASWPVDCTSMVWVVSKAEEMEAGKL